MGIRIVDEVLDHTPWLPPAEKVLLIALAQRANDITRECWPGHEELMRRVGVSSLRSLRRIIERLETLLAEHLEIDPKVKDVLRVSRGDDKRGRRTYAARGHRTVYRVPHLAFQEATNAENGANERGSSVSPFPADTLKNGDSSVPLCRERGTVETPIAPERGTVETPFIGERGTVGTAISEKGGPYGPERGTVGDPPSLQGTFTVKNEPSKSSSSPSSYISPTGGDPLAALGLTRMEIEATSDVIRSAMGERPIRSWSALIAKLIANGDIQEYIRTARQVMAVNVPAYRKAHDWERRATFDDITCKWCGLPPEHACHRLTAVELAELAASVPLHALPKPTLDLRHPTDPQSPPDEPLEPSDAPRNRSLPPEVAALLNGKRMD